MANPSRGETSLVAGDKRYTLDFSFEYYCQVEDLLGLSFPEIQEALQPGAIKLSLLKTLLWGCLQKNHPDVNLVEAARLFNIVGVAAIANAVGAAMANAEWVTASPGGGAENPPASLAGGDGTSKAP